MVQLVSEIYVANEVQKKAGAFPGGLDSRKWPARWFDAVLMYGRETSRVQDAYDQAIDDERGR